MTAVTAPDAACTGSAPRAGLHAAAAVTADLDGGRPRIRWTHAWPVVLRPTGRQRVHLVHGAGGPLGGDHLQLDVTVGPGAALAVRSAGATLVQPGRHAGTARWDTTITVGEGARLDWAPEPTVVSDGAALAATVRVDVASGATAALREVVVLGRHGGRGGRHGGRLDVAVGGVPLLVHVLRADGADPVLGGPGGLAGARAVGTLLLAGGSGDGPSGAGEAHGVRWAWTALAGPGHLLQAVGDPAAVIAVLDRWAQPGMIQP